MQAANISFLLCFLVVGAAEAATEPQKRRAHVPYVRAATTCIAHQVRRQLGQDRAAESVSAALKTGILLCRETVERMVAKHDRIFGAGTGRKFLEGAYAADLPRAVSAQIAGPLQLTNAPTAVLLLTGSCKRHVVRETNRTSTCAGVLLNTTYADGRSGFYFVSDGTALTFSGLGPNQVKPHPDTAVQPIDLVIMGSGTGYLKSKAVGQCEFSNPNLGPVEVKCRAVADTGVFDAAFVSDGTPPKALDPDILVGNQALMWLQRWVPQMVYNDHTLANEEVPRPAPRTWKGMDENLRAATLKAQRLGTARQGTNRFSATAALASDFSWFVGKRGSSDCLDLDVGSHGTPPTLEVTLCFEPGSLRLQLKGRPEDPYRMAALRYSDDVIAFGRIAFHAKSKAVILMPTFQMASEDRSAIFLTQADSWSPGPQEHEPPDTTLFEFDRGGDRFRFEAKLPEEVASFVKRHLRITQSPPASISE